jgi:hypothetical protein
MLLGMQSTWMKTVESKARASAQHGVNKYALSVKYPRKRQKEPKVTVADAFPPS